MLAIRRCSDKSHGDASLTGTTLAGGAFIMIPARRTLVNVVPDEQRREASLGHERVIERQHHDVLVHHVEGMTELARVAHARDVADFGPVFSKELHQTRRGLDTCSWLPPDARVTWRSGAGSGGESNSSPLCRRSANGP